MWAYFTVSFFLLFHPSVQLNVLCTAHPFSFSLQVPLVLLANFNLRRQLRLLEAGKGEDKSPLLGSGIQPEPLEVMN